MTADDSLLVRNTCAVCGKAEYHAAEIPTFVCDNCLEILHEEDMCSEKTYAEGD